MEKTVAHFIFCWLPFSELATQFPGQIATNQESFLTQFCNNLEVPGSYRQSQAHNRNSAFADAAIRLYAALDFPPITVDEKLHSRAKDIQVKKSVERDIYEAKEYFEIVQRSMPLHGVSVLWNMPAADIFPVLCAAVIATCGHGELVSVGIQEVGARLDMLIPTCEMGVHVRHLMNRSKEIKCRFAKILLQSMNFATEKDELSVLLEGGSRLVDALSDASYAGISLCADQESTETNSGHFSVLKSRMDNNKFNQEIRRLTYQHLDVKDSSKHNPCLSAFILESIDIRKMFLTQERLWLGLQRFASYAIQVRSCSVLVAESQQPKTRRGSRRAKASSTKNPSNPLSIHGYYDSGEGSANGEEYGIKSWMEEAESLAFWNQAVEVSRALAAKYVSDESRRTKTNKGLVSHLVDRFCKFLFKNWTVAAMTFETEGLFKKEMTSESAAFLEQAKTSMLRSGIKQQLNRSRSLPQDVRKSQQEGQSTQDIQFAEASSKKKRKRAAAGNV